MTSARMQMVRMYQEEKTYIRKEQMDEVKRQKAEIPRRCGSDAIM